MPVERSQSKGEENLRPFLHVVRAHVDYWNNGWKIGKVEYWNGGLNLL